MKFGRIVPGMSMHRLTVSDFGYGVISR